MDKNERAHMDYIEKRYIAFTMRGWFDKEYYETIPWQIRDSWPSQPGQCLSLNKWFAIWKAMGSCRSISCLQVLKQNAYYPTIDRLDKLKDELYLLRKTMINQESLRSAPDLWDRMAHLVAAAKQNRMLLEYIKAHAIYRRMNVMLEKSSLMMPWSKRVAGFDDWVDFHKNLQQSDLLQQCPKQHPDDNLTTLTIFKALLAVLRYHRLWNEYPSSYDKGSYLCIRM